MLLNSLNYFHLLRTLVSKRIRMVYYFFLLLLFFLCSSCQKAEPQISSSNSFRIDDFPISLNSFWVYERINNISYSTNLDTIVVKVNRMNVNIGIENNLIELIWNDSYIQYLKQTDTSITYYNYDSSENKLVLESSFLFPFNVGDTWIAIDSNDIYSVLLDDAPSDHFGLNYGNCYYISRIGTSNHGYSIHDKLLVKKGIGIIYRNISEIKGIPMRNERLKLIRYKIE